MNLGIRGRRALAVTAGLVGLAIAIPRFLTHAPFQRLGVMLDYSVRGPMPRIERIVAPPSRGRLEPGDRLLALDGQPFTTELREHLRKDGWPRGQITLTVLRGSRIQDVAIPPVKLSPYQRVRTYLYPMVAVVAAPIIAFLLVWRRPDLITAWAFLWFALMQGMGVVYDLFQFPQSDFSPGFQLYLRLYGWLVLWYPASYLHFMTVFPRPRWSGKRALRSPWLWLVVLAYLTPIAILWLSHGVMSQREVWSNWFQIAALAIGVLSLGERYLRRRPGWEPTRTQKVLALLVGFAILGGAGLTFAAEEQWINSLLVLPGFRLVFTATSLAWLTSPLVFAILIADDPAFDPRRLLARSLPYALLSGILAAMYLALVLVSQRLFAQATGEETLAVTLVAALVVAFTFAPLRQSLQRTIDRIFHRDPEGMRRAFDRAGRELLSALSRDEVRASVEAALARGLQRPPVLEWPQDGPPLLAEGEEVPEDARPAVQNLLLQAGVRLENLALQELRVTAERRALEMREAATRAELRALQAQVQPHFLFNALNALSYLTETDPQAAQRFTERLADMLRYTVEAGSRPAALLSEEIAFVEDYLGVARERYETPLAFEYHVTPELLSAAVPPLLLQPLVENSLKHGCSQDAPELRLSLDAQRDDGWITLRFSDNGVPHANGARGLGVGLSNLEQRMRRFAGEEASVSAESGGRGGFAVTVRWRAPDKVAA